MDRVGQRREVQIPDGRSQSSMKQPNKLRPGTETPHTSCASQSPKPFTKHDKSIPPLKKQSVHLPPLALRTQLDLSRTSKKVTIPSPSLNLRSSPEKPSSMLRQTTKATIPSAVTERGPSPPSHKYSKRLSFANHSGFHPPKDIESPTFPSSFPAPRFSNQSKPSKYTTSKPPVLPNTSQSSPSNQYVEEGDADNEIEHSFEEDLPVSDEEFDDNNSRGHKRVRGKTRGLELAKRRRAGERIEINIPEHTMRAVGGNCQLYITEVGSIVRTHATLQVKGWKDIPHNDVKKLILRVRDKFTLSPEIHVDEAIEEDMKRRYYRWRYDLHQKFLKFATIEDALTHPPQDTSYADWEYLVNLWQEEKWKKKSDTNKKNKDKIKTKHCAGTKAFSRIRYENQNIETGEVPGQVDTFHLTHYNKRKTSWVDDKSKDAFERMQMLQNQSEFGESEHMSQDEIYETALELDTCYGYIRGFGAGPKPKSFSRAAQRKREQLEEAVRRAEEANQIAADATKRAEEAEHRNSLLINELEALKEKTIQMDATYQTKTSELESMVLSIMARFSGDS